MTAAVAAVGRCSRFRAVRYRNERQARAGRDRGRAMQARGGLPVALRIAQWFRCPHCRGWHVRRDEIAAQRYLAEMRAAGVQVRHLLDSAA